MCLCRVGVGGGVEVKAKANWERPGGCDEWRTTSDERRATNDERRAESGDLGVGRVSSLVSAPLLLSAPPESPLVSRRGHRVSREGEQQPNSQDERPDGAG